MPHAQQCDLRSRWGGLPGVWDRSRVQHVRSVRVRRDLLCKRLLQQHQHLCDRGDRCRVWHWRCRLHRLRIGPALQQDELRVRRDIVPQRMLRWQWSLPDLIERHLWYWRCAMPRMRSGGDVYRRHLRIPRVRQWHRGSR